ncbi:hypothetical protein VTL71DRAFT_7366 [Oculimacula yallundae]|uniref:GH16 domain-containing protein n=1 Tax=Oculimacula yallundae TaxID=86028 RepID=A0ABR4BZ36_9HELO
MTHETDIPTIAPRVASRGRDIHSECVAQAGRRESSMEAEKSAATLRSRTSIPYLQDESEHILRRSNSTLSGEARSSLAASRVSSCSTPVIPSRLNSSSSDSVGTTSDEADGIATNVATSPKSSSDTLRNENFQNASNSRRTGSAGRKGNHALSEPQAILRQKSTSASALQAHGEGTSRSNSPRLLQDLGHDYSRYPSSTDVSLETKNLAATEVTRRLRVINDGNGKRDSEKCGYPDDSLGAVDPYHGGEKGFILYPDEIEEDDRLHVPADDDDITFRPKMKDYLNRRTIWSTCGGMVLILGLLVIFIIIPILTFQTRVLRSSQAQAVNLHSLANSNDFPLLNNIRRGLIDPDTPASAKTRKSIFDDSTLDLVFSDEFNVDGRTFYEGDDPFWYAPDFWYGATQDLEWYTPDAVTTANGTLQLNLERFRNHGLDFRSGMLHSWNQLCFKGGILEVSVSLAGPAGVPGLWPGAWTMGNLGRPGYLATTEGVWPYTYNDCDAGITPNQSSSDGLSYLPGQKLNSCTCKGSDHPSPGTGRGAPEIDIIEGSVYASNGIVTQSYQLAPFDVWWRPNSEFMAIPDPYVSQMNSYTGGPFQQAVSAVTTLNNSWYDNVAYQKYAFEYIPGTSDGKIAWFVGDDPSLILDGRAIGPNGNVKARQISEEPMSIILNLGMSNSWVEIDMEELRVPTTMYVDYVRLYQKPGQGSVTCDPVGYPTTEYIKKHPKAYRDQNMTKWDQTGYGWPKHKLGGCSA